MSEELKACPLCEASAEITIDRGRSAFGVSCTKCTCNLAPSWGGGDGRKWAVEQWNARPTPHPIANAGEGDIVEAFEQWWAGSEYRNKAEIGYGLKKDLAFKAFSAAARPIANAGEAMREAVARIVSPGAYRQWQSLYDYCIKTGDIPADAEATADRAHGKDIKDALAKANAILSLLPSAPEGDAAAIRESAAKVCDKHADAFKNEAEQLTERHSDYHEVRSCEQVLRRSSAAIRALPLSANAQAEGVVLVPVEPTEAMLEAGVHAGTHAAPKPWCPEVWSAMIAASKGGE